MSTAWRTVLCVSALVAVVAVGGCARDEPVSAGPAGTDTGTRFTSSVSAQFAAAVDRDADPMGPSIVSIPGFGVVLAPPAAIPDRRAGTDPDPVREADVVQDPAFYLVRYDGAEPVRIALPADAPRKLRTVTAAAGDGSQIAVAVVACERAYHHEKGDDRPYDCANELWTSASPFDGATSVVLPSDVTGSTSQILTLAVASPELRFDHAAGLFGSRAAGTEWARLGEGSSASPRRTCALSDGSLVGMAPDDDSIIRRLPSGSPDWTDVAQVAAAPNGLNELLCGSTLVYRIPFGPSTLPMVRVRTDGVEELANPAGGRTGPTAWKLDQASEDLVAPQLGADQGLLVLHPTAAQVVEVRGSVEELTDANGRRRQFAAPNGAPFSVAENGDLTLEPFGR